MNTSDDDDFVTVDMPSENVVGSMAAGTGAGPHQTDGNDDDTNRQRSLLKTLWSEATSTTDLPSPTSPNNHHQLHHRRAAAAASSRYSRKLSSSGTTRDSPSKRRSARSSGNGASRYRVSRHAKIAKRVWLAAFAAFAAAILISIHVFLYRVFIASNTRDEGKDPFGGGPIPLKNGMPILGIEDTQSKMTLAEAHSHTLSSITHHTIDTTQFTIRINTYRRNEQLLLSINHHATCDSVKEIQVIWCDDENDPPDEVVHHTSGKVKIEKHTINSLNERFKVIIDPPTMGILSLDDDVLRPCVALDAAFIRWTRHPERMVGFDVRSHVVVEDNDSEQTSNDDKSKKSNNISNYWKYGYMSTTESSNQYSMTLPRASFIHRDYLDLYTMALPRQIYVYVAQNLECEDIAMSFLVSSLTNGAPPLVADYWAVKSMIKLYSSTKISGGKDHKSTRDTCVNDFAQLLGLKEDGEWPLHTEKLLHRDQFFGYGAEPEVWSIVEPNEFQQMQQMSKLKDVIEELQNLQSSSTEERMGWLMQQKAKTMMEAKKVGMIEGTDEWKERWREGNGH